MRVLFIGHTYHLKTKSSLFLLEMLREKNSVDEFYMDPSEQTSYEGLRRYKGKSYDALVIWQVMPSIQELHKYVEWEKGAYFPMYDYFIGTGGLYNEVWHEYSDFTIINFSRTLHNTVQKAGFHSHYIQYFPKPKEIENWGEETSLFFWNRTDKPNMFTVARVLKNSLVKKIHIHKCLDPGYSFTSPELFGKETSDFASSVIISESDWFENKAAMYNILLENSLYMAPRDYEGIGMSFLEAMSYGRCVIAPDNPTMNEYIRHGETGLLYSWDDSLPSYCHKPINFTGIDILSIQKNTHKYICDGYNRWKTEKSKICDWVFDTPQQNHAQLSESAILYGWKNWEITDQPWPETALLEKSVITKPASSTNDTNNPCVSVITVVFNAIKDGRRETLLQNMKSVQSQVGISIEHIIIDGDSTDGTQQLVLDFKNSTYPIRLLSMKDKGIYDAMNRGIALSKGTYVIFLNSDDYYHNPNGLAISANKLRKTKCVFSFAPIKTVGNTSFENPHLQPLRHLHNVTLYAAFSHQSILTLRSVMTTMHGFDLSYKSAADYDFVLRMIFEGHKGCYVPIDFVSFRLEGISSINTCLSNHETALIFKRIYKKYLGVAMSESDAYRLYKHQINPPSDSKMKQKLRNVCSESFVGIPKVPHYMYSKEMLLIIKSIIHGRLGFLRDFLIVLLNSRFDTLWYLETNKDVANTQICAAEHYLCYGWKEGRDPSPSFSTKGYLGMNPDVAEKGICPLVHWKLKGKKEKRTW